AAAHHEDPLPRELAGVLVAAGVADLATEVPREFRDLGLGEGAVRDHQGREFPGVSLARGAHLVVVAPSPTRAGGAHGQSPPGVALAAHRFRADHFGSEAEPLAQAEV